MHVISRKKLREFWSRHPDSETALAAWFKVASRATWGSLAEVRRTYSSADSVDKWTVFNIGGNKYRLITEINYEKRMIFVRHVLTHEEYDRGAWKR